MSSALFIAVTKVDAAYWEDSFFTLAMVLGTLLLVQFGLVLWIWVRTRVRRRSVPLVIGGWGTRGKSGTERCKAALFHAYGANVFSKTTGCEAMFIHGIPQEPAEEIFLFRPMEKATIYEQVDVFTAASRLGCEVFLYECMALNPRYVEVMQDGWMRDDLGTLTNAYPDHEDVQGPAGRHVAEVIGSFVPRGVPSWTCERQMLPVLGEQARRRDAELRPVSWLDAAMITDDVMERMPYSEHPANIALVNAMGAHLGLEEEFVYKEIADHLIPDLGVLRTYPRIFAAGRSIYFTNGMSANERLGCMGNWKRLGLADYDTRTRPNDWVVSVINNRADRIPRSKVFAAIIAEDITPHSTVIIGTNVGGMVGYIAEALAASGETWRISDCSGKDEINQRLREICERLKIQGKHAADVTYHARLVLLACGQPVEQIRDFLNGDSWQQGLQAAQDVLGEAAERERARLEQDWQQTRLAWLETLRGRWVDRSNDLLANDVIDCDGALAWLGRLWRDFRKVCSLQDELLSGVRSGGLSEEADEIVRQFRSAHVLEQLIVIEDAGATGDQVLQRVIESAPPGYDLHVLGMQNIKGTGLDFAYRWVGLLKIMEWTFGLKNQTRQTRYAKLQQLATYADYHYFEARVAMAACQEAKQDGLWHADDDQMMLDRAIAGLAERIAQKAGDVHGRTVEKRWYDSMATFLEPILDVFDSIKRRVTYQRVLSDYVQGRVSRARTAAIMKDLVKRQKGGWLKAHLDRVFEGETGSDQGPEREAVDLSRRPFTEADYQAAVAQVDADALRALEDKDIGGKRWQ